MQNENWVTLLNMQNYTFGAMNINVTVPPLTSLQVRICNIHRIQSDGNETISNMTCSQEHVNLVTKPVNNSVELIGDSVVQPTSLTKYTATLSCSQEQGTLVNQMQPVVQHNSKKLGESVIQPAPTLSSSQEQDNLVMQTQPVIQKNAKELGESEKQPVPTFSSSQEQLNLVTKPVNNSKKLMGDTVIQPTPTSSSQEESDLVKQPAQYESDSSYKKLPNIKKTFEPKESFFGSYRWKLLLTFETMTQGKKESLRHYVTRVINARDELSKTSQFNEFRDEIELRAYLALRYRCQNYYVHILNDIDLDINWRDRKHSVYAKDGTPDLLKSVKVDL